MTKIKRKLWELEQVINEEGLELLLLLKPLGLQKLQENIDKRVPGKNVLDNPKHWLDERNVRAYERFNNQRRSLSI